MTTPLLENIAKLLSGAGPQKVVADAIGLSQSQVSRLSKGSQPKPENLVALARLAGVSVETLVETPYDEWPKPDRDGFKRKRQALGWSAAVAAQETHAIIKRERGRASVTADAVEAFERGEGEPAPAWLRFALMAIQERGSPKQQDTEPRDEIVYIRQVDIRYAMGDGAAIEDYPSTSVVPFNQGFIKNLTSAPIEKLMLITGHGESMDPTIKENDLVLVDTSENRVGLGDTVWAFSYAGAGYIKRLRPIMQGGRRMIEVNSDNKEVAQTFVAEPQDIHIVGKVVLLLRRRP